MPVFDESTGFRGDGQESALPDDGRFSKGKKIRMKVKMKMNDKKIKAIVQERYSQIAKQNSSCCSQTEPCCGTSDTSEHIGKAIGYDEDELRSVPEIGILGNRSQFLFVVANGLTDVFG